MVCIDCHHDKLDWSYQTAIHIAELLHMVQTKFKLLQLFDSLSNSLLILAKFYPWWSCMVASAPAEIMLDMGSANERKPYMITHFPIGWTQNRNDLCASNLPMKDMVKYMSTKPKAIHVNALVENIIIEILWHLQYTAMKCLHITRWYFLKTHFLSLSYIIYARKWQVRHASNYMIAITVFHREQNIYLHCLSSTLTWHG